MRNSSTKQVTLRIDISLHSKITKIAERQGRKPNDLIRESILHFVEIMEMECNYSEVDELLQNTRQNLTKSTKAAEKCLSEMSE